MPAKPPPPGWGSDDLSDFLDKARNNTVASFANLKAPYQQLQAIDDLYMTIASALDNTPDIAPALMLIRTHASFRGAVGLVLSLQSPEAYMVMRGCLEHALYGFYMHRHASTQEVWLRRHDDAAAKKKMLKLFTYRNLINEVKLVDSGLAEGVSALYDRTIDYGAHPNPRSLLASVDNEEFPDSLEYRVRYFTTKTTVIQLAFRSLAQAGVLTLDLFRIVFTHRFDILGVTNQLQRVRKGL